MPRLGARGPLIALAGVALLGLGALGARTLALRQAERALEDRGLGWAARHDRLVGARWVGLERPGLRIDAVDLSLVPPGAVRVEGAAVDLAATRPGAGGGGRAELPVTAEWVTLRWGDAVLADSLTGTLAPALDLSGPDGRIWREGGAWRAALARDLALGPLAGAAQVDVTVDEVVHARIDLPAAVLSHPLLARGPLAPQPLTVDFRWNRSDHGLLVDADLGGLAARAEGTLALDPLAWDLRLQVEDAPLALVVDRLGIPEGRFAELRGMIGLSGRVQGPPLRWVLEPRAEGLAAEGVVRDLDSLRHGAFTWRAPAAGGEWLARTTGEGQPCWVPLTQAGLVPEAVIAAEDSAYWTHAGYDLAAVAQALDAAGQTGDWRGMRGGSTLTQQLAKNLFLDGERTVSRKVRELLYALELDRRLGKERVLELYLNVVELGPQIYGIGPAAEAYFVKRPDRLSPREAAFLACLLPAPRSLYEQAVLGGRLPNARIDAILANMVDGRAISAARAEEARRAPLLLVPPAR